MALQEQDRIQFSALKAIVRCPLDKERDLPISILSSVDIEQIEKHGYALDTTIILIHSKFDLGVSHTMTRPEMYAALSCQLVHAASSTHKNLILPLTPASFIPAHAYPQLFPLAPEGMTREILLDEHSSHGTRKMIVGYKHC